MKTPCLASLVCLALGCSGSAARPADSTPRPADATPLDTPTAPAVADVAADANAGDATPDAGPTTAVRTTPEMWALLDRLNGWCESYPGECNLYERPEAFPDQVSSGETNGFLSDAKQRLDALGADYLFNISFMRYEARSESDIGLMIGGNFAVDHLGPDVYAAILQRAHSDPQEYLDVFTQRFLARVTAPEALPDLMPEAFLAELQADAPGRVRELAATILAACEKTIADSPPGADEDSEEGRRLARLRGRANQLRPLTAE
jgi:hypothetical protein